MFKKSLLALSIASASLVANAGTITVQVDEVNTAALIALNATSTDVDACSAAATALGVTATGATLTGGVAETFTTAAVSVADGIYTPSSVVNDTVTTCTIVVADTLIGADTAKYSLEGATENGVILDVDLITGVGGIAEENSVIFTVVGGTIDSALSLGATLVSDSGQGVFTLNGIVGNTVLFSADPGYSNPSQPLEILSLAGVAVVPDAGVTELSLSAVTQNTAAIVVDTSDEEKVTNIANQYSSTVVAGFDGIIDVSKERLSLVPHADPTDDSVYTLNGNVQDAMDTDSLVIRTQLQTTVGNLDADTQELTLTGDFTWLNDMDAAANGGNADAVLDEAEILAAITFTPYTDLTVGGVFNTGGDDALTGASLSVDQKTLTLELTDGGDQIVDEYAHVEFTVPGETNGTTALITQDFTLDVVAMEIAATTDMDATPTDIDAGEWTLNGSVITIPYMPFGENTKVIMRHTSTSAQVGDVTVRYMLEDTDASDGNDWVSVGVVVSDVANGVLDIRDVVMNAIMADAGVTKGKVAIEITTNVPNDDVTVYAAYNVKNSADDRGFVGTFGSHGSAQ